MKVATETQSNKEVWIKPMEIELPKGLIGFSDTTKYELLVNSEELPFMWIRSTEQHELGFIVIEPSQVLSNYEVGIGDDDVEFLGISSSEEALILNIVTVPDGESIESATINLIGPIVLNMETKIGKQIIVSNYQRLSARHPILSESVES